MLGRLVLRIRLCSHILTVELQGAITECDLFGLFILTDHLR